MRRVRDSRQRAHRGGSVDSWWAASELNNEVTHDPGESPGRDKESIKSVDLLSRSARARAVVFTS